jgi:hypothetical protein
LPGEEARVNSRFNKRVYCVFWSNGMINATNHLRKSSICSTRILLKSASRFRGQCSPFISYAPITHKDPYPYTIHKSPGFDRIAKHSYPRPNGLATTPIDIPFRIRVSSECIVRIQVNHFVLRHPVRLFVFYNVDEVGCGWERGTRGGDWGED